MMSNPFLINHCTAAITFPSGGATPGSFLGPLSAPNRFPIGVVPATRRDGLRGLSFKSGAKGTV